MIRFILFVAIIFGCSAAHADDNFWDKVPHPDGHYGYDESLPDLLNIKGLTYHEARPIIMNAGWSPFQSLQEGTKDYDLATEYGYGIGKLFWNKKYHELQACSGGVTYCAFLFQNKNGDQLRVVTKGEDWEDARITGYLFNP
jgi:hypothetical protein